MLVVPSLRCCAEPFFTLALIGCGAVRFSQPFPRLLRVPGLGVTVLIAHRRAC